MKKGKYQSKGTKIVVLMLAMMLVFGCAMGGTLAYLMTSSGPVTNTFTVGDINIELWEHDLDDEGDPTDDTIAANADDYKILPGTHQTKDPFVTVKKDSEACWVFVKIVEKNNYLFTEDENGNKTYTTTPYIQWAIDSDWTEVSKGTPGAAEVTYIYGRAMSAVDDDTNINILKNKIVEYDEDLTKTQLNALDGTKPVLEFTAYAVQAEAGATAAAAWGASDFDN